MRLLIVLDCADPESLADFWASALGYEGEKYDPPFLRLVDRRRRWPDLLLQKVPEPKTVKNRLHLDIQVTDAQPELDRLVALGAHIIREPHNDDEFLTTVLADPEGNEFCLIVPPVDGYDWERSFRMSRGTPRGDSERHAVCRPVGARTRVVNVVNRERRGRCGTMF